MSKYCGIRITSADALLDSKMSEYQQPGADVMWFASEESAMNFCDTFFKQKAEMRKELPELYEHERCSLPGAAFVWYEDTLPPLVKGSVAPTGYLGSGDPGKASSFTYLPPEGFESSKEQYGSRQYLYFSETTAEGVAKANTSEGVVQLPAGYQPKLTPSNVVFVHYGSTEFDMDVFERAYTRSFDVKPESGFWASPLDSQNSWDRWCKSEHFRLNHPNIRCEFTVTPEAKILQVSTLDDIAFMLQKYPMQCLSGILPYGNYMEQGLPCIMIDYEAMAKDFDGINYDHAALGNILGPWDCDSICIFNPEVMQFREIELVPVDPTINYDEFSDIMPDEDWLEEEEEW